MNNYNVVSGNSGPVGDVGSHNTYYAPQASPSAPGTPGTAPADPDVGPAMSLYAFADIIGYSKLNARLQRVSQDDLISVLNRGIRAAGIAPERVAEQDQGDARLLAFPAGTDVAGVLALMPRTMAHELAARNRDMAEHARLRLRLGFCLGTSAPGGTGMVGPAPVTVVRLADSAPLRLAMRRAPLVECGVIIDNYLHDQWVRQGFRSDIDPAAFTPVRVTYPDKDFDETAWLSLSGYSGHQVASLLSQERL